MFPVCTDCECRCTRTSSTKRRTRARRRRKRRIKAGTYLVSYPTRWSLLFIFGFLYCKRLPSHTGQGQACTRITRLFVCSWPCRKWPNTQKNGCWLPPSDHIQSKTLFQTRQDQEKGMNGPASLLHSWRWVLLFHMISQFTHQCALFHSEGVW